MEFRPLLAMNTLEPIPRGIYSLPNELLYTILSSLPTKDVLSISPTSHRIYALSTRILHNRLTLASTLASHVLYLEAYHPSARLTASGLYCDPLGTPSLHSMLESPEYLGKIGELGNMYSCFRPQHTEPVKKPTRRHPAGDIPGSRTYPATDSGEGSSTSREEETGLVGETVSLDAGELFTQLCAVIHLVKMAKKGVFANLVDVCDGMIRVWRDWLKDMAEAGLKNDDDIADDPSQDKRILWVNKGDKAVGIRCAVKERKWKRDNPILVASEDDVAVSYHVEFRELYIRTSHLLFKLEESLEQEDNTSSRAMIFRGAVV